MNVSRGVQQNPDGFSHIGEKDLLHNLTKSGFRSEKTIH